MRVWRNVPCVVAIGLCLAPVLRAQDSNASRRLTFLTFSAPVQVPGLTLPAGTYRFQLASAQMSVHAVQILSQDGQRLYVTFPAIPDVRSSAETRRETVVMFEESAPDIPPAIREWFYAGEPLGEQFVYPRSQAVEIAKTNHVSVPSMDDGRIVIGGDPTARADFIMGATVSSVDDRSSAPTGQPAPAPSPTRDRPRALPLTASTVPLTALIGGLLLASGALLRGRRIGGHARA